jgi:DNA-binding transcriptional LysR family regulator
MSSTDLIHPLPRHLKMSELRAFTAVLEHRSFSKAAAVLHLTQPALSKSIAGLEDMLGVKLFDRVANGVEPTAHGRSLAPRALAVFEELRRAAQNLALLSNGTVGSLRIGVLPMPAIPFVPVAVNRLLDQHPGVLVSLVEARETELLDRLRRRDIELAILRSTLVEPGDDLRVDRLFDERPCVVAAKTHPLATRSHLQWRELLEQRWALPPSDCHFYAHVKRSLDRMHMRMPKHAVEATSIQLQHSLVLHAGMLSFGMCSQARVATGEELVVRLPFELPVTGTVMAALSLKSHGPSPLAKQFVGHIQALVRAPTAPGVPVWQDAALLAVAP